MNFIFKKKDWTKDEKRILELLLEGETELLIGLRRQLMPPFFLWVERRHSSSKSKGGKTQRNEYTLDLIFEGNLQEEFSVGNEISLRIDDLTIVDASLKKQLSVVGMVNYGILTNIRFISNEPVKWPKYLKLKDWHFWLKGKPAKQRQSLEKLAIPLKKIQVSNLRDSWIKDIFTRIAAQGLPIGLWSSATSPTIASLEQEIGTSLPGDFKEFLTVTNGANISSLKIFGSDEVYVLEGPDFTTQHLLIFSTTETGDVVALDLSQITENSSDCPVILFSHEDGEIVILAKSFKEWLERVVE